ncbi:hypothetical protein FRC12_024014 [Ceratobasidium sp. 428]|nr:hypothetical protein FRC12_024014 [Ceratobasidium sp. 428]
MTRGQQKANPGTCGRAPRKKLVPYHAPDEVDQTSSQPQQAEPITNSAAGKTTAADGINEELRSVVEG